METCMLDIEEDSTHKMNKKKEMTLYHRYWNHPNLDTP